MEATGKIIEQNLVDGFNHLEKYESQWEGFFHIPSGNLT